MQIQLLRPHSPGARGLTNNKIVKPAEKRISRGHRVMAGTTCRTLSSFLAPNRLGDEQQFRSTDIYGLMRTSKPLPAAFRKNGVAALHAST
jgi:hypothetical protein